MADPLAERSRSRSPRSSSARESRPGRPGAHRRHLPERRRLLPALRLGRELLDPRRGRRRAGRVLLQREALELALYTFHYLPRPTTSSTSCRRRPGVAARATRATTGRSSCPRTAVAHRAGSAAEGALPPGRRAAISPGKLPAGQSQRCIDAITRRAHLPLRLPAGGATQRLLRPALTDPALSRRSETAPPSSARRRGSTGSTSTRSRCGSAACASLVWPWFFRLPWFGRFDGYAAWHTIVLRCEPR